MFTLNIFSTLNSLSIPPIFFNQRCSHGHLNMPQPCLSIVDYMEQFLFQSYSGTLPQLFLHYINDSFDAASCTCVEFVCCFYLCQHDPPSPQFIWKTSETCLVFQDLNLMSRTLISIISLWTLTTIMTTPVPTLSSIQALSPSLNCTVYSTSILKMRLSTLGLLKYTPSFR